MNEEIRRCYQLLELEPGTLTPDAIRQAYRQLVKVWHPDRFPNDPELQARANAKLKEINNAFQLISKFLANNSSVSSDTANIHVRQEASRATTEPPEFLTKCGHKNLDYCIEVASLSKQVTVQNIIADKSSHKADDAVGKWPYSADFEHEVVKLFTKRFVTLAISDLQEDGATNHVSGTVNLLERLVTIDPATATSMTPLFLLSLVFVRDMLTMRGLQRRHDDYLKALQANGFVRDELLWGSSYRIAEDAVAKEIARLTFHTLAKTLFRPGFNTWLKLLAHRYGHDASIETIIAHFSCFLITDAPYGSNPIFSQSFFRENNNEKRR